MRALALLGLTTLLLTACEGDPPKEAAPGTAANTAREIARLREMKGAVTLEREGRKRPAAEEAVFARDIVETGEGAEVTLRFGDGREVELGPDARLTVGEDATGLLLQVDRGFILSRVPHDAAQTTAAGAQVAIQILTPFGITRVGSGQSEVKVDVGAEAAKVDVVIGTVELVTRDGKTTQAAAGDAVSLTAADAQLIGADAGAQQEIVMLAPIQVTVFADGRAELRKKGERRWRVVGKKGEALSEGDRLRVRRGRSTVALDGSGTALTLASGSEVTFGGAGRDGDTEEAKVQLGRGRFDLALAPNKKSRVQVGELSLESEGGGFFHVEKTRHGIEVSATTGKLLLRRGESTREVNAGEFAKVSRDDVASAQVAREEAPGLILPSRSGIRVFHPGVDRALIDWRGEPGEYQVRVGADPRFERVILQGAVGHSHVAVEIPRRGIIYWDVRTADGKEVDSGSAVFAPEPPLRDLERLRNDVPEGPDKTTIYYQDKTPSVTFTYAKEDGAAKYRVAVFRAGALDKPVAERTSDALSAPLEAGVLSEGSYLWSVTPLSGAGEELRGGRMNKLDIVYDNSVPTLLIRGPANGHRAGKVVRTHGVAPLGSRLYINGRAADLDDKSRFDAEVSVDGSRPLIIYRLVRSNAADAFYVRVLRRGRG